MPQKRTYRRLITGANLRAFQVVVKETDLMIHALRSLDDFVREKILEYRGYIEAYITRHPEFGRTLTPWTIEGPAPAIVCDMARAGTAAGVGPMAAVAGAIAEHVGRAVLEYSDQVIVENGGDIFIKLAAPATVGIFAGRSPLSLRIGVRIDSVRRPMAVCTSSGTVGHSLSLGRADAVCSVSDSCALADAAATAIGNHMADRRDLARAIEFGKKIDGIKGVVVILGDQMGLWGDIEAVPLKGKKG